MTDFETGGMFGDFDLEQIDIKFKQGTYQLKLDNVQDREAKTEYGDAEKRYKIFNFVIEDDNPEVEDFNGEALRGVFITYWPGLNQEILNKMSTEDKSVFRKSIKVFQVLARAFGVPEEQVKAGKVNWDEYVDQYVIARLYADKNGEPAIQTDSFQNVKSVEL